jgi:hypothetical protein
VATKKGMVVTFPDPFSIFLLLLLLNRLPTDITVGQGLEKTHFYNFLYNFFTILAWDITKREKTKQKIVQYFTIVLFYKFVLGY